MRNQNKRISGFTLIELLVVIAIIAILAAILFPVFAQARAKARQTSCLSNIKQLTLGVIMYAQDYDETIPSWDWGKQYSGGPAATKETFSNLWIFAIYPYVKNAGVYTCPSDRQNLTPLNSQLFWWTGLDKNNPDDWVKAGMTRELLDKKMSYTYNEVLQGGSPSLAAADKPADIFLLADGANGLSGGYSDRRPDRNDKNDPRHKYMIHRVSYANACDGTWEAEATPYNPKWDSQDCTRHSAGENIGFADGHAKFLRNAQITWDLWQGDQAN